MNAETKKSLFHVLLSFLLSVGIALPLCFTLSFENHWPFVLLISFLVPAVLTLLSGRKRLGFLILGLFILSQIISAFTLPYGGPILSALSSTGKAIFLFLKGQRDALPLYGLEFAVILSLVIAFISFLLAKEGNGFFPALSILLFTMLALWYMGKASLIVLTIPAIIATVLIYVRQTNEDLSLWRVLPVVLIITLLSFFILPMSRTTIKPLEETADKIRETITNYLFFTQTRTIFSLEDQGYHMGGPAEPNKDLVLRVKSPEKVYLRGAIKNQYTGRSWIDTTGGQRHLYTSPRWNSLKTQTFDLKRPDEMIANKYPFISTTFPVTVEMVNASASTLFISQRFADFSASSGLVPYFNIGSEMFITRNLYPQDEYQFSAKMFDSSKEQLAPIIKALETMHDPQYDAIYQTYTHLPEHMEQSLYQLVNEITKSAATSYDKALAIENHLNRYYAYTLTPEPVTENMDFVSYFIHVGKEGYCTYFASAMTTFAQMAGLPARYVEGFLAVPGENNIAYVTGESAHAWTEIYFPGFGWVVFDATPGETPPIPPETASAPDSLSDSPNNQPTPTPSPEDANPPPSENEDKTPEESPEPSPTVPPRDEEPNVESDNQKDDFPYLWLLVALFILFVVAWAAYKIYHALPKATAKKAKNIEMRYFVWVQAIYDILRIDQMAPLPQESPTAFAARANYENDYPLSLMPMAQHLSFVGYSPHPVEDTFIALAQETFESLYSSLPWYKKLRFIFTRAFFSKRNQNSHIPSIKELKNKTTPKRIKKAKKKDQQKSKSIKNKEY